MVAMVVVAGEHEEAVELLGEMGVVVEGNVGHRSHWFEERPF